MALIVDYKQRENQEGKPFYALILQGGIEMVESRNGKMYATARKASMPSTFSEEACKALLGQEIKGDIIKKECEPYEYQIQETGETVMLNHHYEFVPENATKHKQEVKAYNEVKVDKKELSLNGVH